MSKLNEKQKKNVSAVLRARPIDVIMADLLLQVRNCITAGVIPEETSMVVAGNEVPLSDLITEVVIIQVEQNK